MSDYEQQIEIQWRRLDGAVLYHIKTTNRLGFHLPAERYVELKSTPYEIWQRTSSTEWELVRKSSDS